MSGQETLSPQRAGSKAVYDPASKAALVKSAESVASVASVELVELVDPVDPPEPNPQAHFFQIVLKPLSHPELAEIGIEETLFPVGRNEPPFDGYPADAVSDLSRRHARIFCENGIIHIADMGSKNGTAVNGVDVRQKTARLQQGDELQFGRTLTFQVQLRSHAPVAVTRLVSLALQPADDTAGLQPIIVTRFPFLISKADPAFARYRDSHSQQVNFLSRRHAHVFLKRGLPQVEDLGSTNGTFVNGRRLDEQARALEEGDTVGFGGRFFVYRVVLQKEEAVADPTMTRYSGMPVPAPLPVSNPGTTPAMRFDIDRTTFVGAPNSFLEIFCVDSPPLPDLSSVANRPAIGTADARTIGRQREPRPAELPDTAQQNGSTGSIGSNRTPAGSNKLPERSGSTGAKEATGKAGSRMAPRRRQSQVFLIARQVARLLSAGDRMHVMRAATAAGVGLLVAAVLAMTAHLLAADQREIRSLIAAGSFEPAARAADRYLEKHPENAEVRQLATQTWLKAFVPAWLAASAAGDGRRAAAIVAAMRDTAEHDPDAPALLREMEWIGELDRFVGPGAERPIRIDADERRISALLEQWDADPSAHQRAAAGIALQVPAFGEAYAAALSRLRRLQGDSAVYLAAIERFRGAVTAQLDNDHPETVGALARAYAEKYPRLIGLERYEADMQQYLRLRMAMHGGRLGPVVAQAEPVRYGTPVFQAHLKALIAARRLPDTDLMQHYRSLRTSWRAGETERAFAALQLLTKGVWGAGAAAELRHKSDIVARFNILGSATGTPGHAERLLALQDLLEAEEDGYFLRAALLDPLAGKARLLQGAEGQALQAARLLQQYRQAAAPDDAARRDDGSGASFPNQMRILAQARGACLQAERLYRLLGAPAPTPVLQRSAEILVEASAQQNALRDARPPLPQAMLNARLALLDPATAADAPP